MVGWAVWVVAVVGIYKDQGLECAWNLGVSKSMPPCGWAVSWRMNGWIYNRIGVGGGGDDSAW